MDQSFNGCAHQRVRQYSDTIEPLRETWDFDSSLDDNGFPSNKLKIDVKSVTNNNHFYNDDCEPEFKLETGRPEDCVDGTERNKFEVQFINNKLQTNGVSAEENQIQMNDNQRNGNGFNPVVTQQPIYTITTDPVITTQPQSRNAVFIAGNPSPTGCDCCICLDFGHTTGHHGSGCCHHPCHCGLCCSDCGGCDCGSCHGCHGCSGGDCNGCSGCDCSACVGIDCSVCSGCDCNGCEAACHACVGIGSACNGCNGC